MDSTNESGRPNNDLENDLLIKNSGQTSTKYLMVLCAFGHSNEIGSCGSVFVVSAAVTFFSDEPSLKTKFIFFSFIFVKKCKIPTYVGIGLLSIRIRLYV